MTSSQGVTLRSTAAKSSTSHRHWALSSPYGTWERTTRHVGWSGFAPYLVAPECLQGARAHLHIAGATAAPTLTDLRNSTD